MRYLNEIREGESVVEHYLCKSKQTLKSRAGKSYLSLKLQDKTGSVDAKVWEMNNDIKSFEENEYIKVDATALVYQNAIQLNVKKIRRSMEGEYDPAEYIPCSQKDSKELFEKLSGYIKSVQNKFIRTLLEEIFFKDEFINKEFILHSAAKTVHHSYMGGLVEHTVSVVEICDFMSGRYNHVNRDLLIAIGMLHDIGKVYELSEFPINDYTDCGQLLGHLYMGAELIQKTADKIPGFPQDLANLMKHCILSHHGEFEYGSPVLPKTMEAFILHCADNMDAKVKAIEELIDDDSTQGNWVGYQKMLQRNIRKSEF